MARRPARSALGILGAVLLGAVAAAALAATAAYVLVGTRFGTGLLVPRVLELVNGAIRGSVEVDGFRLRSRGVLEVTGVRIRDPDGEVVIAADRALAHVDLIVLRLRTVSADVELERPSVLLARDPDGGLTIARAFQPRHPSPKKEAPGESTWTIRLARLVVRDGSIDLEDAAGQRQLSLRGIDLRGRASTARAGSDAEVLLDSQLAVPEQARVTLDAAASLRGGVAHVPRLRAAVGDTALDAIAEWDLAARSGRVLVTSVVVSAADLKAATPSSPLAGDVQGTLFAAASDGVATAVFDLEQRAGPGRASGAAALRMASPLAAGFDLDLKQLDPARVVAVAPAGEVTLRARGWLAGTDPRTLRAAVDVDGRPSVLRGTRVGPLTLRGTAAGGTFSADALDAAVPGARVRGNGRFALQGAVAARVRVDGSDLAAASRAVERVAGLRLPAVAGAVSGTAEVSGTTRAPRARFDLVAPQLRVQTLSARDLRLSGELAGTLAEPQARATASAGELRAGAEVIRDVDLVASIQDRAADARVTATTLRIGPDPLTIGARGTLARDWRSADVAELTVSWPGTRYATTAPAHVDFAGPKVDRLELASGPTRIALEGGLVRVPGPRRRSPRRTEADARLVVQALDLASLPRDLLPQKLGLGGVVAVDARVTGPLATPEVTAHLEAAEVGVADLAGLSLAADAVWDGAKRRARLSAGLRRAVGGEVELRADVPAALGRARASEPVALTLQARGLPLEEAARLAGRPDAVTGLADLDLTLSGTIGAPALSARALLAEVLYGGRGPFQLDASLDAPGTVAKLDAAVANQGERALEVTASVPLDLSDLLRDPARTGRGVLDAPLTGQATIPEFALARFAGDFGLPADLSGRMRGGAELRGTLREPRGSLGVEGAAITAYGYQDGALQLAILLSPDSTGLAGSVSLRGEEVLQASALLDSPVERLGAPGRLERLPLEVDLVFPGADLARTGGRVPLTGRLDGRIRATGSLAQPVLDATVHGRGVSISGKPLGDVNATARAAGMSLSADVRVEVASGGVLTASLQSTAEMSLEALRRGDLAQAPTEARLVADRVDLAVLEALLPGTVRAASGELGADLAAKGPLRSLRPIGSVRVTGGRAAIAEMGDWHGIEVDASLTADAFVVNTLQARRGRGTLDAKAEARGLAGIAGANPKPADFTATLRMHDLTIPRAGQDLATLDLEAQAKGTLDLERLRAEVTVPRGTVVLPERSPRAVQTLEQRDDIEIVSSFGAKPENQGEAERARAGSPPYRFTVRVLLPNRFFVTSANPRMNLELQADTTFDAVAGQVYAEGQVEVLRGFVEPIGGRTFTVERARVTFTGGAPKDAVLDVVARYQNPSADVTVTISGSTSQPVIKMTSQPPMDEAQIAMLIATGRTELKAGSGGVGTLTGEEAGKAALGAVATQIFKNVIADKLPVDSVALSSAELRAGKYVTDKIYVGYTRNFEARPELNENTNELRVEYQISPRWTLESRYGDARTGGASIIWSKDY